MGCEISDGLTLILILDTVSENGLPRTWEKVALISETVSYYICQVLLLLLLLHLQP